MVIVANLGGGVCPAVDVSGLKKLIKNTNKDIGKLLRSFSLSNNYMVSMLRIAPIQ